VTNKVYVANQGSNNVTVIDGGTNGTSTITAGTSPSAIAVNLVTDTIYVANSGSKNVTIIDGATGTASSVTVGTNPVAVAINATSDKVYVANYGNNSVSEIISGTFTATLRVETNPNAVAVNPITNKIYVGNSGSNNVSMIDGATNSTTTVTLGTRPIAVAVNLVTNKIYVANKTSNNVTVINGATNSTTTVPVGTLPWAVAVNPVTNRVYVTNSSSNSVAIIDGATNSIITTVHSPIGPDPTYGVAVNPVTNKIYVAVRIGYGTVMIIDGATDSLTWVTTGSYHYAIAVNAVTNKIYVTNNSASVSVIDGAMNDTTTVTVGTDPIAVAVNPVTNKIYVANMTSNNVTVINGATNSTTTVPVGIRPWAAAVNPVTNRVYVANSNSSNVTVIDGATNNTTTVAVGTNPYAIAVNPVTNKVYVADSTSNTVTVIDGATNSTTTVAAGSGPYAVAVNPVTNRVYVANSGSNNMTVIDETPLFDTKLHLFFDSLPNNTTNLAHPSLTGIGVNRLRPGHTGIWSVQNFMNTSQSSWNQASITSGSGTDSVSWTWSWGIDTLLFGENLLCAVALDSQATSTNNPGLGTPFAGNVTVYPIYRLTPPPAAAPVLISPLDKSVGQPLSQTFSWNAVNNATYYTLQVSIDSLFFSFVFNAIVAATSQAVSGLAVNTTYYWRVNAGNSNGVSAWSSVWRFSTIVVGAPILSSPTNGAVSIVTTPALSWNTVATATSYSVQVSTDSNFSTTVINQSNITATSYQATGLSINTVYYWRVDASNGAGTGPWSLKWNFTIVSTPPTTPGLVSPINATLSVQVNPTFSWNVATGATSYTLQVSTDSNFSSQAVNDSNITSTSHSISSLSAYTLYYWRVKAVNAVGPGAWSLVWNFMTGSSVALSLPILISPANGSIDQPISLTLVWNKVSNATNYYFQVATDSVFSSIFKQDSTITDTMKSDSGFAFSIVYYWRVRAKNAGGTSAWSDVRHFTTTATGVLPFTPSIPHAFSVSNFSQLVRYTLPKTCHVSVRYFNLKGRLIASLVNSIQGPGYYTLPLGRDLFSSGTFIQVFEAGTFVKKNLVAVVR
jgi:YVTN family beta-propeller protein